MKRRPTGPRVRANKGTVDALTLRSPRLSLTHYAPSLLPLRPEGFARRMSGVGGERSGVRQTREETGPTFVSLVVTSFLLSLLMLYPAPSVHGWLGLLSLTLHLPFTGGAGPCGAK